MYLSMWDLHTNVLKVTDLMTQTVLYWMLLSFGTKSDAQMHKEHLV